jgi:hypothetical protein
MRRVPTGRRMKQTGHGFMTVGIGIGIGIGIGFDSDYDSDPDGGRV